MNELMQQTVELPMYWIVILVLYGALATGLVLAAAAYYSRVNESREIEAKHMREALKHFCRGYVDMTKQVKQREAEIAVLSGQKKHLAEQYVKVQNEYAWYRIHCRGANNG